MLAKALVFFDLLTFSQMANENYRKGTVTGMKRVCILRGSPRRNGNTNALTDIVAARLAERGCTLTELTLYDMALKPCLACRLCQRDPTRVTCAQADDMPRVFDAVMDCELLLLATPIYAWYCTPPMKCALDRMVYAMNMYYGEEKGASLWQGRTVALITTCGYRVEKGADLFEEGMKRYCKHSMLHYAGMLCERHLGYDTVFMDEKKRANALAFADGLLIKE